jgi:polysaccharide export outer membrane protein
MIPEVQATIEERLRNRAIEPQAIITVKQQLSSLVSVLGEVNTPLRAPINPAGERVLDAISQAGGPRYPGYETYLTLTRGDQKRTIYFNRLVNEPSNNIFVQPGDTIYVFRENRSFVVLGATGLNGKYNFEQETLTVSEALGKGGGLLDERANPGAVYIYRLEPRQTAIDLGFDPKPFPGERVPVIYSFDLRADRSFFLTSGFQVRDKDIIYVANAAAVELLKALTVIRSAVASGQDVRDVARRN